MQKTRYRKFFFLILRLTLIPLFLRFFFQRKNTTIIYYHKLPLKEAKKHFPLIKKYYKIISFEDFVNLNKDKLDSPPYSLVITFDDGHKSNYELLKLFKYYSIVPTIFLCSGIINSNHHFWWTVNNSPKLKLVSDENRLSILAKEDFFEDKEYNNSQSLSLKEMKEMKPFVSFQSHTKFHPILPNCSAEKSRNEIYESKVYLENLLSLKINSIAYPNGDFTDREINFVKNAKYSYAHTTIPGFNNKKTDPYMIKRISINDKCGMNELVVRLSGLWSYISFFNRKLRI